MGLIPGGKNGLAKRVIGNMDMSAAKIAVVACLLCTLMGAYVTYQDFRASYEGWGTYVSQAVGTDPGMQSLALIVSLAPQLIQTTLNVLFVADPGFIKPWSVSVYVVSFTLDSGLDYLFLTRRGGNPLMALLIVFGVFFVLSEVLLGVFGTLTVALAKEAWGKKKAGRSPMPSMAMPSPGGMHGPSPRGARTPAGKRSAGR